MKRENEMRARHSRRVEVLENRRRAHRRTGRVSAAKASLYGRARAAQMDASRRAVESGTGSRWSLGAFLASLVMREPKGGEK